jgi:hypothetical protein
MQESANYPIDPSQPKSEDPTGLVSPQGQVIVIQGEIIVERRGGSDGRLALPDITY